mmetsp:Transcript_45605/g.143222  ORF Transcript_45605/g.143222 Transcript_45605/m.143222 type:complete len:111 (-) Transcript_45605:173-505(-)
MLDTAGGWDSVECLCRWSIAECCREGCRVAKDLRSTSWSSSLLVQRIAQVVRESEVHNSLCFVPVPILSLWLAMGNGLKGPQLTTFLMWWATLCSPIWFTCVLPTWVKDG